MLKVLGVNYCYYFFQSIYSHGVHESKSRAIDHKMTVSETTGRFGNGGGEDGRRADDSVESCDSTFGIRKRYLDVFQL